VPHSGDWRPRRVDGSTAVIVEAGGTVVAAEGIPVLRLNGTAVAILGLCDGTTTLDEMVDACVTLFDVGQAQARREVAAALDELVRAGVVT
jgi:hypothetical protein